MYLLLMVGVASGLSPASAPQLRNEVCAALAACALFGPGVPAVADGQTEKFRLPPVNKNDVSRCAFRSSSMGQANAARDKLYDLRFCDMGKSKADGFDLSGAILSEADFSGASFRETMLSKAYAKNSKFKEADFTNAVVDRVSFEGSDMQGAVFANAVLTGTSFDGANLRNVDFTEALIGQFDLKNICKNPTLEGENPTTGAPTRDSAGCP
ncbi:hypothetical protein CTAYLR_000584 [Chrysophaeum taylorii]|uniref:Pentapeptide repeat-containing protein n=1 Tax=Chrysophaeum taylorii TaxID=2483200 RepID=A0AAD7XKB9_9STRA|nr:hypothetical protein CTAYLR_000584 [Chrysophaeum taylorii]